MKSIVLLTLLLLVSCGTSKKPKSSSPEEVGDITNESFKWPAPKLYNSVDDFIDGNIGGNDNVLKNESLSKKSEGDFPNADEVDKSLDRAIVACYRRNFNLANKIFDSLLKEYRKNPIFWNQVGNCFMMQGSQRKALLYFNKSKDLKGNYAPPINNIGVIFQKEGNDQKAIQAYKEAKKISSFSLTPIFNLAQIYAKYGFIEEGKQLFSTLVKLNNNDEDALYGLGFMELANGNFKGAVNYFQRLSRDFRRKPEVAVNVAYSLALSNSNNEARDVLSEMNSTTNKEILEYQSQIRRIIK